MSKVTPVSQLDCTQIGFTKPELIDGRRASLAYHECPETNDRRHLYVHVPMSTLTIVPPTFSPADCESNSDVTDNCTGQSDQGTPTSQTVQINQNKSDVSQDEFLTPCTLCPDDPLVIEKLTQLEQHLVNYLYERSAMYFDGRKFSLDRFQASLLSACNAEKGTLSILIDKRDGSTRIKDQFDSELTVDNLTQESRCLAVLVLRDVVFEGKSFYPTWYLVQAKVYKEDPLDDWCLQDASDSSVSHSPDDDRDQESDVEETLEPLITNDDDKNFF